MPKKSDTVIQVEEDVMKRHVILDATEVATYSSSRLLTAAPGSVDPYYIGDAYDRIPLRIAQEWEIDMTNYPYLAHIKSISNAWPHMRYLADFMEVGTTPLRWKLLRCNEADRLERACRTNIVVLDFPSTGKPTRTTITQDNELRTFLGQKSSRKLVRMIVVEDLSRHVIEILGAKFDIDPGFFREHINHYSWYNIRDRWMNPPSLIATKRKQKWTQVRFVRPRYYRTKESFQRARQEANVFNILRRPDNDQNQWPVMDDEAIVALTRTKSLLWVDTDYGADHETIGILLVDPTVREGHPLWHGYHNWASIPSMYCQTPSPPGPPRTSLFDDLVHWATEYPWFPSPGAGHLSDIRRVLTQPVLYLACAEWIIICEYIKTRLGQIEWELGFPEQFHHDNDQDFINESLKRLHTWRRLILHYREMIEETINESAPLALDFIDRPTTASNSTDRVAPSCNAPRDVADDDISQDFNKVASQMKELQDRTDRLTSVLMAAISIEDSRRGLQENHNVARLTWLATLFIPLSFICGLFSMQQDISSLKRTFGWYFAAAVPVTVLSIGMAMSIHLIPLSKKKVPREKRGARV